MGIQGIPEVSDPIDAAAIAGLYGAGEATGSPNAAAVAHAFGHHRGYSCDAINTLLASAEERMAKMAMEGILSLVLGGIDHDQSPVRDASEP